MTYQSVYNKDIYEVESIWPSAHCLQSYQNYLKEALTGVAQWVECCPANQDITGLIPSWGIGLGCGPGPHWGCVRGNQLMFLSPIDVSLSFSLHSLLSKNKIFL